MANEQDGAAVSAPWRAPGRRDSGRWLRESSGNDRRDNGRCRGGRGGRGSTPRAAPRQRPNFFVGFRITTESITTQIEQLQQSIAFALPELEMCLIDLRTLHVTLCVLRLPDDEAVQQATSILQSATPPLVNQCFGDTSPTFAVTGWRFFGANDILFAPLRVDTRHGRALALFAELLHARFSDAGLDTDAFRKPFTPHVTIWKTTKNRALINELNVSRERAAFVQNELFAFLTANHSSGGENGGVTFGSECPASIELLSMVEKEADGYYKAHASARFQLETTRSEFP